MPSQADRIHQLAQQRLQNAVKASLLGLAAGVALERTDEVREAYAQATADTVSAGQLAAGQLALAYIAGYAAPTRPPDLAGALEGKLMTPDEPGAIVGLLRTWARLDEGADELQAREDGGTYAGWLAGGDLQEAQNAGLEEGADAADREPRWAKMPAEDCCDWCQTVAEEGYRFHEADTVPFHQSDRCSVAPEF